MKEALVRHGLVLSFAVLLAGASATEAAVLSLRAVRVNDVPITPTDSVQIAPGDTVEAEMYIRGWAADTQLLGGRVSVYQFVVDVEPGATSSGCGTLWPVGWPDSPEDGSSISPDTCTAASDNGGDRCFLNEDCPGGACAVKVCTQSSSNAGNQCSLDKQCPGGLCTNPSDFIFKAFTGRVCAIDRSADPEGVRYRYGCSLNPRPPGQPDGGVDYYAGSIILVASNDALGTFTYTFRENEASYLQDVTSPGNFAFPTIEPLTVVIEDGPCDSGGCCLADCACEAATDAQCAAMGGAYLGAGTTCDDCPGGVASASPPNCAIDAAIPHLIDSAAEQRGWNSVDLTFCAGTDIGAITTGDFSVTVAPADTAARTVSSVTPMGGNVLRVTLNRIINLGHWTCLMHDPSGSEVCWGREPADADADRMGTAADVAFLIDGLDAGDTPPAWQADVDRSGNFAPGDVLACVDLLLGGGAFDMWMGQSIPVVCPTAP